MAREKPSLVNRFNRTARNALTCTYTGALGVIRTRDTRFRKPMLYPLSYEG